MVFALFLPESQLESKLAVALGSLHFQTDIRLGFPSPTIPQTRHQISHVRPPTTLLPHVIGVLFAAEGIAARIAEREELDLLPYATVLDNYASSVFVLVSRNQIYTTQPLASLDHRPQAQPRMSLSAPQNISDQRVRCGQLPS